MEYQLIEPRPIAYDQPDHITVKQQVADGELLFRYANNSGLTPNDGFIKLEDKKSYLKRGGTLDNVLESNER